MNERLRRELEMDEAKVKAHRIRSWICLAATVVLLAIAFAAPALASAGLCRPVGESQGVWFQRSGSVATVMALFGGIVIPYAYNKLHQPGTWGELGGITVLAEFKTRFQIAEGFAFVITVVGTAIWGYGDLVWNWLAR